MESIENNTNLGNACGSDDLLIVISRADGVTSKFIAETQLRLGFEKPIWRLSAWPAGTAGKACPHCLHSKLSAVRFHSIVAVTCPYQKLHSR